MESIYSRRSIRKYREDDISLEEIDKILNAGRVAPSGKNKQPWKFLVYGGEYKEQLLKRMKQGIKRELEGKALLPDTRQGLPDADYTLRVMRKAPIVIVVLNTQSKSPFEAINSEKRITEIVDTLSIGAAVENMLLAAEEMGIGTLWIGNTFFAYPELAEYIETECQIVCAIALGYPAEKPQPRPRKELKDIVEYYI